MTKPAKILDFGDLLSEARKRGLLVKKGTKTKFVPPVTKPAIAPSPWHAIATVSIINEVFCETCGTTHRTPGANTRLTKFRHIRTGAIWATAAHIARFRPDLPHEHEIRRSTVAECFKCDSQTPITTTTVCADPQNDIFEEPAEFNLFKPITPFPLAFEDPEAPEEVLKEIALSFVEDKADE